MAKGRPHGVDRPNQHLDEHRRRYPDAPVDGIQIQCARSRTDRATFSKPTDCGPVEKIPAEIGRSGREGN